MKPDAVTVGPFDVECYLLAVPDVIVIDPGGDAAVIRDLLKQSGKPVCAYLLTHGHIDHIAALAELLIDYPAPVYLHPQDSAWAFCEHNRFEPFYPPPAGRPPETVAVRDGMGLQLGDARINVIATPGHTPGSVCYHLPALQMLFSGDTLFQSSVGRTDLEGGDGRLLQASLRRLASLPGATAVYPGHGPSTTLEQELRFNPFMQTQP